ncbi:Ni,Fe-hydrogenase I cytochrome b subunit [Desulfosporosinus acidiphilus SJ4]|uniref:Ni,Fe-hydrogenase I cytochrome b subunit n=1 Tax=Desulfosporosinus acidiphilus (strain DSM 22704 / JCM 16185 / SJ4) TaxID=646529 RepID=I4D9B4_DESAJ|nr:cytochrome b/b6 domain-containing protein [Desulfosporosinus acidiphilus]AFM42388.1 Ni,Fe-hydrogenase I cytochrome b subunit [Desulfosporosinus acidiphilus SJ4]
MVNPLDHPFTQRLSHWINLINFLVLCLTGWFIHFPYPGVPMSLIRNLHFIFAYFLLINGIVRFYISFFGKNKDYDSILLNTQDVKNIWPQTKYYLFLGKHPETGKYNPLQKIAYIALPILTVFQAFTGFILYKPEQSAKMLGWLGGLAAVRGLHFLIMCILLAIIAIHVYLVFTTAFEQFLFMFFGKMRNEKGI